MAQTAQLVHELVSGIVDSTGAVVSSGQVTFCPPGSTTPLASGVWSDYAATTPLSQPVVLSAGGTATVYLTVPARMIVKKSDGVTTVIDTNNVDAQLAGAVYIKNANINAGAETTLDSYLSSTASSSSYLESSGATSRSIVSRLQDQEVSFKDFGAVGDGVTDDTVACQAALDHCGATGKDLLVPAATFLISGALSLASYTKKFNIRGCGAKSSIIKQSSTTANGMTFSYGGSTDWGAEVKGIGFTCSTTSSGAAISDTNANNLAVRDCELSLFRTGLSATSATGVVAERVTVLSTDGNAAAAGLVLGSGARAEYCPLTGSSNSGTAITCLADSHISEPTISGWATGISSSSTNVRIRGGKVSASTTGISLAGDNSVVESVFVSAVPTGITLTGQFCAASSCTVSNSSTTAVNLGGAYGCATSCRAVSMPASSTSFLLAATYCTATACVASASSTTSTTGYSLTAAGCCVTGSGGTGCATGISIGAVADCRAFGNALATNTTDISINGSATNYSVFANKEGANLPQYLHSSGRMSSVISGATITTNSAVTPVANGAGPYVGNRYVTSSAAPITLTVNATATTGLLSGDVIEIYVYNTASGTNSISFNAQYKDANGSGGPILQGVGGFSSLAPGTGYYCRFFWNGSNWIQLTCVKSA